MGAIARRRWALVLGLALLAAACDSATQPTPTPAGSSLAPTVSPTSVVSPSDTPDLRPTLTATASLTAAPTVAPTATATPTPPPTPTAAPTAEPTPAPATILRFRREQHGSGPRNVVDCTDDAFAGTIHLVWRISGATGVTLAIDGPGIYDSYSGTSGDIDVPFACEEEQHTYTLTTTGGDGPPASETRTISRGEPEVIDMAVIGPNCPNTTDFVPVSVTWEIAYATGVEVWVDGVLYAPYSGKQSPVEGSDAGTYDCNQPSQEYMIVTTGGFGPPATLTLTAIP
jgi:hypothetical protein